MRGLVMLVAVFLFVSAGLEVVRSPFGPFARFLHRSTVVHVNSVGQATSYVARLNPTGTNVSCANGIDGWTYMCSYNVPYDGSRRFGVYTMTGIVRATHVFEPRGAIVPPDPQVSLSEYVTAAQAACNHHYTDLNSFPAAELAHPDHSRSAAERLIEVERRFGHNLYTAGSINIPGPTGGNRLYNDFVFYQQALNGLPTAIGNPDLVRSHLLPMQQAQAQFDTDARQLGLNCTVP